MINPRLGTLIGMIGAAAATRLIPHPPNLTSVTALALFGGAYFCSRSLAFIVPLAALFASDLLLGLYPHMEVQYLSFVLIIGIGFLLRRHRSATRIALAVLASSLLFFLVTNFGVWLWASLYPKTPAGLLSCYIAALPFLRNTVLGDLLYALLLFGGFRLLESRFLALRAPAVAIGSVAR